MNKGWIKLHRKILNSPIWKTSNASHRLLWITILLMANWESNKWVWDGMEYKCEPGEFITSLNNLSKEVGISVKSVRLGIRKLERTFSLISTKRGKTGTRIRVLNWDKYQVFEEELKTDGQDEGKRGAHEGHTRGTRGARIKNNKNNKNKRIYSENSHEFRLALLLFKLISERYDKYKKPNINTWAKSIDLMIRIDGRSIVDIEKVIRWCQQDNFWQDNILSTVKLRKQFDKLILKMEKEFKESLPEGYWDPYSTKQFKRDNAKYDHLTEVIPSDDSDDYTISGADDVDWEGLTPEEKKAKWQELKAKAIRRQ